MTRLPTDKWFRYLAAILLIALTTTIGNTLYRHTLAFAGGSDSSGYVHNSRLILEGKLHRDVRPIADLPLNELERAIYQPLGFLTSNELDKQTPTYPFGYPIILAAFRLIANNDTGILMAIVTIGCLTPISAYFLSRKLDIGPIFSLATALIIGASPLYMFMAMQPMSDVVSTLLATTSVLLAFQSKGRPIYSILLGVFISLSVLTRIPNVLIILPIVVILYANKKPSSWYLVAIGGVPGAITFLLLNQFLYGSPFTSGYGNIFALFKFEYFTMTMEHFAFWLTELHTPLVTIAFLATIVFFKKRTLEVVVLWLWALSFIIFYAFFYYSHETWWYLRFILPALPAIAIGACLCLDGLFKRLDTTFKTRWINPIAGVVALIFLTSSLTGAYEGKVFFADPQEDNYPLAADWAIANTSPEDSFLCMQTSGCLFYYTPNAIVRWDALDPENWSKITEANKNTEGNLYAILFQFEIDDLNALSQKAPGNWTFITKLSQTSIFRLDHD